MLVFTAVLAFADPAELDPTIDYEGFECIPGFPDNDKRLEAPLLAREFERCAYLCQLREPHYILGKPDGFTFNKKGEQPSKCFCEYQLLRAKESERILNTGESDFVACVLPDVLPSQRAKIEEKEKTGIDEEDEDIDMSDIITDIPVHAWDELSKRKVTDWEDLQKYTPVVQDEIAFAGNQTDTAPQPQSDDDDEDSESCRERIEVNFGKVVSVSDGDTLFVSSNPCLEETDCHDPWYLFEVCLAGLDTPELDSEETLEKKVASIALKATRRETMNKIVRLQVSGIGKNGCLLATLHLIKDPHAIILIEKKKRREKPASHENDEFRLAFAGTGGCPAGYADDEEEPINPHENRTVNQYLLDVKLARKWKNDGKPHKPWRAKKLQEAVESWQDNEWTCVHCPPERNDDGTLF